jgi:hypothetical protein
LSRLLQVSLPQLLSVLCLLLFSSLFQSMRVYFNLHQHCLHLAHAITRFL